MNAVNAKTLDPSMEEILASIRRIIADDADAPRPAAVAEAAAVSEPDLEPDGADEAGFDADEPAPAPVAVEPPPSRLASAVASARTESAAPPAASPAPAPAPIASAPPPAPRPEGAHPREALTSRETDASVSQAFGTLSHTVLTHQGQTLDDLVTAMLKPMLREWLDDNLPPLVERLVRNEIERVARGGR